jgi:hypothetical protein
VVYSDTGIFHWKISGFVLLQALVTLVFFVMKETTSQSHGEESTIDSGVCEPTSSWDHERGREEDGVSGSECREDSPLLTSGGPDHDLYTREKVEYYETLAHEEEDNNSDTLTDVRRTIAITGGGACEI